MPKIFKYFTFTLRYCNGEVVTQTLRLTDTDAQVTATLMRETTTGMKAVTLEVTGVA